MALRLCVRWLWMWLGQALGSLSHAPPLPPVSEQQHYSHRGPSGSRSHPPSLTHVLIALFAASPPQRHPQAGMVKSSASRWLLER